MSSTLPITLPWIMVQESSSTPVLTFSKVVPDFEGLGFGSPHVQGRELL